MGVIAAGLGTLFSSVGGAVTAGIGAIAKGAAGLFAGDAAGGGAGGLIGGLLGGLGQGMMAKAKYKEEERQDIAREKRLQDSYEGVGDAMRFWEKDPPTSDGSGVNPDYQRVDAMDNQNTPLGERRQEARMGEQYRSASTEPKKRYTYDPASGRIQMA